MWTWDALTYGGMIVDEISEQRLSQVNPSLASKIKTLYDTLMQDNIEIRVVQGLRTIAEQNALYAKGRTVPPLGKAYIVTNTPGGYSWHCFGCACDCVPGIHDKSPWEPDWEEFELVPVLPNNPTITKRVMKPDWQAMISAASTLGLNCGANWTGWKDYDHFQMTGRFPVAEPTDEVRHIAAVSGLGAVWDVVNGS